MGLTGLPSRATPHLARWVGGHEWGWKPLFSPSGASVAVAADQNVYRYVPRHQRSSVVDAQVARTEYQRVTNRCAVGVSALAALLVPLAIPLFAASTRADVQVRDGWTFITDYALVRGSWTVTVPSGRKVEVGTGIFIAGSPRGSKRVITDRTIVTTYGVGSIHARTVDGGPSALVSVELATADVAKTPPHSF